MGTAGRRVVEGVGLALALLFVVGMAYLPHADAPRAGLDPDQPALLRLARLYGDLLAGETEAYEYTLHVDENMHWSRMASVEREETLRAEGIYDVVPEGTAGNELRGYVHERGFFVALVHFHQLTGLEWITIFHLLPAFWAGVTAYLVWAALRPWPGAPVAAALVGLVPTTARFLGPGFLVPIGFGLAWIAAALVLLANPTTARRSPGLLVLVTVWAFFIHLIAGFAVLMLLLISIPLQGKNVRSFALLTLTAALPLLVLLDVFGEGIQFEVERLGTLPLDLTVFDQIGLPFLLLWGLGCGVVLTRREREPAHVALRAATIASMAALGFIVIALTTRAMHYALYDRWHQPYVLLATLPAAAGLVWIAHKLLDLGSRVKLRLPARSVTAAVLVVGFVAASSTAVAGHLREPYYHTIEDSDWEAFTWAAENLNGTYDTFLTHPWKAPVFHAMTGKEPRTFLRPGSPEVNGEEWPIGTQQPASWLVERNVTIVFARQMAQDEYQEAAPGVWILNATYAQRLAALRASAE